MSSNQQFPFRADHVGSLLRPAQLARAREAHAQGQIQATSLHEIEDSVIVDAVRRQEDVGMPVVTDGGFTEVAPGSATVVADHPALRGARGLSR